MIKKYLKNLKIECSASCSHVRPRLNVNAAFNKNFIILILFYLTYLPIVLCPKRSYR